MDRFLCPRAILPTMQYPSTGEAMQRTYELHAFSNVAGNTSAFHTINDYNRVTLIVHMERNMKLAGLTTEAVCSAWVVLPLLLPGHRLFVKEAPLKHCSCVSSLTLSTTWQFSFNDTVLKDHLDVIYSQKRHFMFLFHGVRHVAPPCFYSSLKWQTKHCF